MSSRDWVDSHNPRKLLINPHKEGTKTKPTYQIIYFNLPSDGNRTPDPWEWLEALTTILQRQSMSKMIHEKNIEAWEKRWSFECRLDSKRSARRIAHTEASVDLTILSLHLTGNELGIMKNITIQRKQKDV